MTVEFKLKTMPTYAISDIHGNKEKLARLFKTISLGKTHKLIFLGDYIDRGLNSKGVLDLIINLKESGYDITTLRGNHEQMILDAIKGINLELWLRNAGEQTLSSFYKFDVNQIPKLYLDFLNSTSLYAIHKHFILVHAGINMKLEKPLEDNHSLLWQRKWWKYYNQKWLENRTVIHGHTPMTKRAIQHQKIQRSIICIDNGSYMTHNPEFGSICAYNLDSGEYFFSDEK